MVKKKNGKNGRIYLSKKMVIFWRHPHRNTEKQEAVKGHVRIMDHSPIAGLSWKEQIKFNFSIKMQKIEPIKIEINLKI